MKKIIIAVVLGTIPLIPSRASVHETGFEQSQQFVPGPLPDSILGWSQKGAPPFSIVPRDGGATGQMLECRSDVAGAASRIWCRRGASGESNGKVLVEFDIRLERSGSQGFQGNVHLGNFPAAPGIKKTGMAVILSFRGSGRVCTFDGDSEVEIDTWRDGEWMPFKIEIDSGSRTFSIFRDGKPLAPDFAFADSGAVPVGSFGLTYYSGADARKPSALAFDSFGFSAP